MGSCCSTTKVSGSNSNTPSTTKPAVNIHSRTDRSAAASKPASATPSTVKPRKQGNSSNNHHKKGSNHQRHSQQNVKSSARRPGGVIPCGKRTDFGYDKDFDSRYTIGKLLGHGQFGYTYVATDNSNGDRVAVKRIEKSKGIGRFALRKM